MMQVALTHAEQDNRQLAKSESFLSLSVFFLL